MIGNNGHTRSFKTYKPGVGMIELNKTNITASDLGLSTDTQRDNLIDWTRGEGVYAPNAGERGRTWLLGDIIHSTPAVLFDDAQNRNVLFVGSNDGFLHCFVDSEGSDGEIINLQNDTVYESWAFVPWELVSRLKNVPPQDTVIDVEGDNEHDIFVDGTPLLYTSNNRTYLTFGLRKGGSGYYTVDVTNYESPGLVWQVSNSILSSKAETLGESWTTPLFATLKTGTTTQDVVFYAGGYDSNQELTNPGAGDTKGRAVFAVDATSPSTIVDNVTFAKSNYSRLNYCITDLTLYDDDDDGCDDLIYAASLGGEVFVFNDMDNNGVWEKRWLFSALPESSNTAKLKKFMYAPRLTQETWGDWVDVGCGDREEPLDENMSNVVSNRLYAIKNKWKTSPWDTTWVDGTNTMTDANLVDITADILQSDATAGTKELHMQQIESGLGWFITLENPAEKVVSPVIVYNKVAYFTTYQPMSYSVADPCTTSALGISRLYGVNYANGNAVYDSWNNNGTINLPDGTINKPDRIIKISNGMMPEPKIAVTPDGPVIVWGDKVMPTADNKLIHRYFWQQQ
jgi:type IV pilus assembly protein PilY1